MFFMTRHCFDELCTLIISNIGESNFKSELYIETFLHDKDPIFIAHEKTSSGFISGEVKLAITLRLMAGGSCFDLGVIFYISSDECNKIMYFVLKNWIIKNNVGRMNIEEYLNDIDAMSRVSVGFSQRFNGILKGAIGAIDGWLVCIVRPSFWRDGIKNPASFFSRKGFYALNVQVIVDDKKSSMVVILQQRFIT